MVSVYQFDAVSNLFDSRCKPETYHFNDTTGFVRALFCRRTRRFTTLDGKGVQMNTETEHFFETGSLPVPPAPQITDILRDMEAGKIAFDEALVRLAHLDCLSEDDEEVVNGMSRSEIDLLFVLTDATPVEEVERLIDEVQENGDAYIKEFCPGPFCKAVMAYFGRSTKLNRQKNHASLQ